MVNEVIFLFFVSRFLSIDDGLRWRYGNFFGESSFKAVAKALVREGQSDLGQLLHIAVHLSKEVMVLSERDECVVKHELGVVQ